MRASKKRRCDIPNCRLDALANSLFCGPHEEIKIPRGNEDGNQTEFKK